MDGGGGGIYEYGRYVRWNSFSLFALVDVMDLTIVISHVCWCDLLDLSESIPEYCGCYHIYYEKVCIDG